MAKAAVVGIYRKRNAATMARLVDEAQGSGWTVALWALDEVDDKLASVTLGSGPGQKFALLNLLLSPPPADDAYLLVVDDDVEFAPGALATFLELVERARFGIAQPAHASRSHSSHDITVRRRLSVARLSTYVEIGPLFAVAPEWRDEVLPFPDSMGMGWGIELLWYDLQALGCLLGIIDATPLHHRDLPGLTYDMTPETIRLLSMLEERGFESLGDMQRTKAYWRPWQRDAPWVRPRGHDRFVSS